MKYYITNKSSWEVIHQLVMEPPKKTRKISKITTFCFLLHLPEDLIINILLHILSTGYMRFLRAKATCKRLKDIGESPLFYRSVDFFLGSFPWRYGEMTPEFHRECHLHENPTYLLRIGVSEVVYKGRFESGILLIKRSAELRFDPARYIYYMMVRAFWDNDVSRRRGHILERNTAYSIRKYILQVNPRVWNQSPCEFVRTSRVKFAMPTKCWCTTYNPWHQFDNKDVRVEEMCDSCYWIIETLFFFKIITENFASFP